MAGGPESRVTHKLSTFNSSTITPAYYLTTFSILPMLPCYVHGPTMYDYSNQHLPIAEEVGTDHVSDHALRFSSDVSMELMYRLSFCRNCESLHPGVGLNGKSS